MIQFWSTSSNFGLHHTLFEKLDFSLILYIDLKLSKPNLNFTRFSTLFTNNFRVFPRSKKREIQKESWNIFLPNRRKIKGNLAVCIMYFLISTSDYWNWYDGWFVIWSFVLYRKLMHPPLQLEIWHVRTNIAARWLYFRRLRNENGGWLNAEKRRRNGKITLSPWRDICLPPGAQ